MKRHRRTSSPRRTCKRQVSPAGQGFLEWQARHRVRLLKLSILAEEAWIKHLHQSGMETSGYPREAVYLPELGITHTHVCFPDALKEPFRQWFTQVYLPGLPSQEEE